MKTELTKKELEHIKHGLSLLLEDRMENLNEYAKEYKGYNPSGCSELSTLVAFSLEFNEIEDLLDKIENYIDNENRTNN